MPAFSAGEQGSAMSEDIFVAGWQAAKPQPKAGRFDRISIAAHWLTVVLVAAQFAIAWLLELGGNDVSRLLFVHRSIGTLTWIVVVLRLIWRHAFAHRPPFPASMPKLQQRIAKLNEYGLYALLLMQPLTGLGNTLLHGRPFRLFIWQVPAWFASDKAISHLFQSLHELGGWMLLALIGLHAAAALFHGLILRDGVLQRMLPWTGR
jgi:superoxide oxidase